MAKPQEVQHRWHLVDASDKVLGRLATAVATVLMGKDKPSYTPHVDVGDFVVVVNAEKVRVTGRKRQQKQYDYYTYYPGGRKVVDLATLMDKRPEKVVELAVQRMLPKNALGRQMFKKLKVYRGPEHPHAAQQPQPLQVKA
jgi:large subunit ribosomal protein L13